MDPHKVLSIPENIEESDLRRRYKKLCKMYHPDKMNNDDTAHFFFTMIQEAYENIKSSRTKIEIPRIDSSEKQRTSRSNGNSDEKTVEIKSSGEQDKKILIPGTNITDNDIRILGEKFQDPWFHPSFNLTDMFGEVNVPKKKKK